MAAMIISFLVMAHSQTEKIHDFPGRQQSSIAQTRCCAAMKRVWLVCSGCSLHGSDRSTAEMHCYTVISRRSAAANTNRAVRSRRRRAFSRCSAFSRSTHVFAHAM
jgi:hypothetical protein